MNNIQIAGLLADPVTTNYIPRESKLWWLWMTCFSCIALLVLLTSVLVVLINNSDKLFSKIDSPTQLKQKSQKFLSEQA